MAIDVRRRPGWAVNSFLLGFLVTSRVMQNVLNSQYHFCSTKSANIRQRFGHYLDQRVDRHPPTEF